MALPEHQDGTALSEYEERIVAELEAQFSEGGAPPPRPRLSFGRLTVPAAVLLGGIALLMAAHHGGLLIRVSDFWGFSTASIASTLSLAGHALLLAGAFILGRVWHQSERPASL